MRSPRRAIQLALCLLALLAVSVKADTQKYDAVFVFGDSLADNGNDFLGSGGQIPPSTPPHRTYFNGRFSNGYNAFEYLWQKVGGGAPGSSTGLTPLYAFVSAPPPPLPLIPLNAGVSFAFGGTGTGVEDRTPGGDLLPGLQQQVVMFRGALGAREVPKKSLFVIVAGTNDYLSTTRQPSEVTSNIIRSMLVLYDAGARDFLVMDVPDLGALPGVPAAPGVPNADRQYWSALTATHNQRLDAALDALEAAQKKIQIYRGRFANAFATLPTGFNRAFPAIETFAEGQNKSACLFTNPATCPDMPAASFSPSLQFVFWDILHPTTAAHSHLAQYLYDVLAHKKEK